MRERSAAWVAAQIKPNTVLALDISDIRKTYAARMENLGDV